MSMGMLGLGIAVAIAVLGLAIKLCGSRRRNVEINGYKFIKVGNVLVRTFRQ